MQPILENKTLHPALHRVTAEMSECDARPGMMWAARALGGRDGRSSVHVCVDCTRSPLGRRAVIGVLVGVMLSAGALVVRKWLVAPESRMAHRLMVSASVDIVLSSDAAARA